jgi:hypothetical protein
MSKLTKHQVDVITERMYREMQQKEDEARTKFIIKHVNRRLREKEEEIDELITKYDEVWRAL